VMATSADHAPGGTSAIGGASVARIGFGAMQLAGPGGRPAPDHARAHSVLRRALELGINHIDTASFYGDGLANQLIREALHPYPDELVIVSKVGAAEDASGALSAAQRPQQLRAQVEADLSQLGVERLDAVNLRRLDHRPGILAEGDQLVDLDSQLAELVALRDEGKIDAIGLSAVSLEQLRQALPVGVACVQNVYGLLDRAGEPLLELCRRESIAWVPFFPLGSAFPGRPKVTDRPEVISIADRLDATPAQVGLAWLLAHAPNILLIPGTTSPEHLQENVAAGALELDAAARAELDAIGSAA